MTRRPYLTADRWLHLVLARFMVAMLLVVAAATVYALTRPTERLVYIPAAPTPPAPSYPEDFIVLYAQQYGVPWRAALALARSESGMRPDAVGHDRNGNSYGIMQLNERWFPGAKGMTVEENVRKGVSYLADKAGSCAAGRGEVYRYWNGSTWAIFDDAVLRCAVDRYRGKRR
jgi:soluble lytic murein transglycosylase-like protein